MAQNKNLNNNLEKTEYVYNSISEFLINLLVEMNETYLEETKNRCVDNEKLIDNFTYSIDKVIYSNYKNKNIEIYESNIFTSIFLNSEEYLLQRLSKSTDTKKEYKRYCSQVDNINRLIPSRLKRIAMNKFENAFTYYFATELNHLTVAGASQEQLNYIENKRWMLINEIKDAIAEGIFSMSNSYLTLHFTFQDTNFAINFS